MATILLVDDEKILRTLMRVALERENHQVFEAASSSRALALARQHTGGIDLLIAEIALRSKNGIQLAEALETKHPGIRCLFLSRFPHAADLVEDARLSGRQVVREPFDIRALLDHVNRTLGALENGAARKPPVRSQESASPKRRAGSKA